MNIDINQNVCVYPIQIRIDEMIESIVNKNYSFVKKEFQTIHFNPFTSTINSNDDFIVIDNEQKDFNLKWYIILKYLFSTKCRMNSSLVEKIFGDCCSIDIQKEIILSYNLNFQQFLLQSASRVLSSRIKEKKYFTINDLHQILFLMDLVYANSNKNNGTVTLFCLLWRSYFLCLPTQTRTQ